MLRTMSLVVALVLFIGSAVDARQAISMVEPTQEIPRNTYKTWSLFLICNPEWVTATKSADLRDLFWRFLAFGDAIGRENLAVWFWKQRMGVVDPRLSENVDVARSAEYCRTLALQPSKGPYLVVTTTYPDLKAFPAERAVFTLGGVPVAELSKLLGDLTDQLLLEGKVEAARQAIGRQPAPAPEPTASLWLRFIEATRRAMLGVRCAVGLQVNAGVLTAELRGCPQ